MKGKISRIKNMEDELVLPVTTVEAIYMEDGITKLSDEMKDVLKYEEFDNESVTTEIPSVKEEINGIKKDISEINSSLEESVKFEVVGEGTTVPPINGGGSYVYDDTEIRELINETNASLENKANLNSVFSMANMGQDVKEAMTGGSVAVVGKNTVLAENIVNEQVLKSKIQGGLQDITHEFLFQDNSLINWDGNVANQDADPYNRHKCIMFYEFQNEILKFTNNTDGAYDTAFKYMFYDSNKSFISGSGVLIRDISSLKLDSNPVAYDGTNIIIDFAKVKSVYPNAKYVCVTFLKSENVKIYDISKKSLDWLDIENNETILDIKNKISGFKLFDKPFVIFSFDWYSNMFDKRYQILKNEYGYNATFCLDGQTNDYNLDSTLTRNQFNEMLENGWDYALYGGIGDRGTTEESWTEYIKGLVKQKESIGIFNPVMYNTPDNNGAEYIAKAVKNNGFKLQRCNTQDNLLKNPNQFQTGAVFMSSGLWKQECKNKIDQAIANKFGVVFHTHLVIEDSSDLNDGADTRNGHCYESSFREILNYLKTKVDNGEIEILTAREFYSKYHKEKAIEYDYNRETKRIDNINSSLDNKANKSEVDNNINELDVKIAENKTLTDSEISKLKEIANTWEAFKSTGGTIGGSINANNKVSLIGDEISFKSENHNKGLVFNDKVSTIYDWKNNRHIFRVDETDSKSTVYANDFYFGQYSKSSNGYTKLPNGFIIQWGHKYLSNDVGDGNICTTISFPIEFPGNIWQVYLTPCVNEYAINDEYSSSWERPPAVYKITPSNFEFVFKRAEKHFGSEIRWFAIGY